MKIKIDEINIRDRIRHGSEDYENLAHSMQNIGLINPILVDENKNLISGYRRLMASKKLGWEYIDARIIPIRNDDVKGLDIEYHENIGRQNLSEQDVTKYREKRTRLLAPEKPGGLKGFFLRLWGFIKSLFKR
jgi:ParB family chromosome partitioning protein